MATKLSDAKPAAPKPVRKPAPAAAAKPKPAPAVADPAPVADAALLVKPAGQAFKIKDLVDRVATASGAKKKDLKTVVEAVLAELGQALSEGKELNLPPLGKARVNRQKGDMLVVKLKRGAAAKSGKKDVTEGVAAAED